MAVILYLLCPVSKGYDTSASISLNGYTDVGGVSSWALTAMQWANAEGLINGTSGTTLSPTNGATALRWPRSSCASARISWTN